MTTPPTRDHTASAPADVLKVVLGLALLLVLGLVAYFILPKVEVHYRSAGLKPPWALAWVFAVSHFCVNYSWALAVLGGLMYAFARNPTRRGDCPAA